MFRTKSCEGFKKKLNYQGNNGMTQLNIDGDGEEKEKRAFKPTEQKNDVMEAASKDQSTDNEISFEKGNDNKGENVNKLETVEDAGMEDLSGKSNAELQEYIRNMKRTYLYQENDLIEKFELEKYELRENYEEDKLRLKKAFENEKTELLKEIERKDKMLQKLAELFKEQQQKDLDFYRIELEEQYQEKSKIFVKLGVLLKNVVEKTRKITDNNKSTFGNLDEFKSLKESELKLSILMKDFEKQSLVDENQRECDFGNDLILQRSLSDPACTLSPNRKNNSLRESKARSFDYGDRSDDDIQHEMAEVYRKQKTELVKLFSAEKEEERKRLADEKKRFERETRNEYDSRMSVERKAWQDTIEDLEREINILKFEREQLDRNYCLGMDEVRTEFELEKQQIYRRFSQTQALYEDQLKHFRSETPSPNCVK